MTDKRIIGHYVYNVYLNGIKMFWDIISWQTALAHAEKLHNKYIQYNSNTKVEILNVMTGEIVTYQEARSRADALKRG